MTDDPAASRHQRGLALLKTIGGDDHERGLRALATIAPDLAGLTVAFPYGEILCRPGLDLDLRQFCTVAMLLAHGSAEPQLKFHMEGFLNAGGDPRHLAELLFVAIAILGFPAAINAIAPLRAILHERRIPFAPIPPATEDDTRRRGLAALADLAAGHLTPGADALGALCPDLIRWSIDIAFGEALARDGLPPRHKHLAILSMLAAAGNRRDALAAHLRGALNHGITRTEIVELLIQLSVYAGFPAALNALTLATEIFQAPPTPVPPPTPELHPEPRETRRQRGLDTLARAAAAAGEAVITGFDDIAPEIGRMIIDHAYGDVLSHPGLDLKTRELAACAALAATATQTAETPLRVHVNAALTAGASRSEIVETLLTLLPFRGYPVTIQAIRIAAEEFAKRPEVG